VAGTEDIEFHLLEGDELI